MPELPEVETILQGVARRVLKSRIQSVDVIRAGLRRVIDPHFSARLASACVTELTRRGKYMIMRTDRGDSIIVHLGMSGRFLLTDTDATRARHTHVIFHFPDGLQLRFVDPRRFGAIDLIRTEDEGNWPSLALLGPEPMSEAFSPDYLSAAISRKSAAIKAILLDQRVVAGLGNIYVCEILFRARVNPFTQGRDLTAKEISLIVGETRQVLAAAIAAGGSTLRDYVGADGEKGGYKDLHLVYDRAGQDCPQCAHLSRKGVIRRAVQGGRSSFYCPLCQGTR